MFSFRLVLLYSFADIFAAEAEIVLLAHRECIDRDAEYEASLQPKRMGLSGDVYHQFFHGNVGVKQ